MVRRMTRREPIAAPPSHRDGARDRRRMPKASIVDRRSSRRSARSRSRSSEGRHGSETERVAPLAAGLLAWGAGVLLCFAASMRAFDRDREDGWDALLARHGATPSGYLAARIVGLAVVTLALVVAGHVARRRRRRRSRRTTSTSRAKRSSGALRGSARTRSPSPSWSRPSRSRRSARVAARPGYVWLLSVLVLPALSPPWTGQARPGRLERARVGARRARRAARVALGTVDPAHGAPRARRPRCDHGRSDALGARAAARPSERALVSDPMIELKKRHGARERPPRRSRRRTLSSAPGRHALVGQREDGTSVLARRASPERRAPKRGAIAVLGGVPWSSSVRARVGWIPLGVRLPDVLRVTETLAVARSIRKNARGRRRVGARAARRRSARALAASIRSTPSEMRAVALAEALASPSVSVMLIEEPFVVHGRAPPPPRCRRRSPRRRTRAS